jgi:hypothetical protein
MVYGYIAFAIVIFLLGWYMIGRWIASGVQRK